MDYAVLIASCLRALGFAASVTIDDGSGDVWPAVFVGWSKGALDSVVDRMVARYGHKVWGKSYWYSIDRGGYWFSLARGDYPGRPVDATDDRRPPVPIYALDAFLDPSLLPVPVVP